MMALTVKKFLHKLSLFSLFAAGIWCIAAFPLLFSLPLWAEWIFYASMVILFAGSIFSTDCLRMLFLAEASLICYFIMLTPTEQFKNTQFQRSFTVKPDVLFLENGKFKVIDLRKFNYRTIEDFDEIYADEIFDVNDVVSVDMASVYWDGMALAAHTMFCFNFSDGRQLAVSVEPRLPMGSDREAFTCMTKQQELLFILSVPEDLFSLRIDHRKEDFYLYRLTLSAHESEIMLTNILQKVHEIFEYPEFYHLITANCITALKPALQKAKPEIKWDMRTLFNGLLDRMFFDAGILVHEENESFESLKSRSLIRPAQNEKL